MCTWLRLESVGEFSGISGASVLRTNLFGRGVGRFKAACRRVSFLARSSLHSLAAYRSSKVHRIGITLV